MSDHAPDQHKAASMCPRCAELTVPNEETLAAMRELEEGRGKRVESVKELFKELNSDD